MPTWPVGVPHTTNPAAVPHFTPRPLDPALVVFGTATGTSRSDGQLLSAQYEDWEGAGTTGISTLSASASFAVSTTDANTGVQSLEVTSLTGGGCSAITPTGTSAYPVVAGQSVYLSAWVRADTTTRSALVRARWYTAAGVFVSDTAGTAANATSAGYTQRVLAATAPATTAFVAFTWLVSATVAAEKFRWDTSLLTPAATGTASNHQYTSTATGTSATSASATGAATRHLYSSTATGTSATSASATGKTIVNSTATGTSATSASATGRTTVTSTATGTSATSGTATGTATNHAYTSTATGTSATSATATGRATVKGTATGTSATSATATGAASNHTVNSTATGTSRSDGQKLSTQYEDWEGVGTTGIVSISASASFAVSTTDAKTGVQSLEVTSAAGGSANAATPTGTSGYPVTAGQSVYAEAWVRADTTTRNAVVNYRWYTAAGTFLSTTTGTSVSATNSVYAKTVNAATAPATAAFVTLVWQANVTVAAEKFRWDTSLLTPAATGAATHHLYTGTASGTSASSGSAVGGVPVPPPPPANPSPMVIRVSPYHRPIKTFTPGLAVIASSFSFPLSYSTGGAAFTLPLGVSPSSQATWVVNFNGAGGYVFEYVPTLGVVKAYSGGSEVAPGTNLSILGLINYVAHVVRGT